MQKIIFDEEKDENNFFIDFNYNFTLMFNSYQINKYSII